MGIGAVIGGALQGLGAGVAQQGQMDAAARRDAALEALRHQNSMSQTQTQYDLADRNDARSVARGTSAKMTLTKTEAEIEAGKDKRNFQQQVTLKAIDLSNDTKKMQLAASLDKVNAQFKRDIESGDIADIKEGDDGQLYGITRSGETKALGVYSAPKESDEPLGIGLGTRGPGPVMPAAKPAPKSKASINPTGQASGGKTYSLKEAQATAKNRGISVEEVHKRMRQAGYKLTAG